MAISIGTIVGIAKQAVAQYGSVGITNVINTPTNDGIRFVLSNNSYFDVNIPVYQDVSSIKSQITDIVSQLGDKIDKIDNVVQDNIPSFNLDGSIKDSGKKLSDFAELTDGKIDKIILPSLNSDDISEGLTNKYITSVEKSAIADISNKVNKVVNPISGNFAGLDNNGNLIDTGKNPSSFASINDLSSKANSNEVYLKTEVYNKTEIDNNKAKLYEYEFVASSDNITTVNHNISHDNIKDDMIVLYNGYTLLVNENYTETSDKLGINLGWGLNTGEKIKFKIYKNVR